jgi:hypothetical protein
MEEPPHRQLNYKKYDERNTKTLAWPPNHAIIRKNIVRFSNTIWSITSDSSFFVHQIISRPPAKAHDRKKQTVTQGNPKGK